MKPFRFKFDILIYVRECLQGQFPNTKFVVNFFGPNALRVKWTNGVWCNDVFKYLNGLNIALLNQETNVYTLLDISCSRKQKN